MANLRIQWINLLRDASLFPPVPVTIQLLGTIDDIVDESDNVDIQCGANFIYKSVPETGHVNVIDFSGPIGQERQKIFLDALCTENEKLKSDKTLEFKLDPTVEHIVFIMHGIRDYGHWTRNLSQAVAAAAERRGLMVKTVISDYGYFPMIGFLLQPERQRNVRWFINQYTEALARYPKAKMSFIGHSNGTYLLASALERYRACAFERTVFAGSVVNRDFPWDKHVSDDRVAAVQNYVATADWVVAVFPAIFERLRKARADLGSAGHTGFARRDPPVYEVTFIKGDHGAAIVPATLRRSRPSSWVTTMRDRRQHWRQRSSLPASFGLANSVCLFGSCSWWLHWLRYGQFLFFGILPSLFGYPISGRGHLRHDLATPALWNPSLGLGYAA